MTMPNLNLKSFCRLQIAISEVFCCFLPKSHSQAMVLPNQFISKVGKIDGRLINYVNDYDSNNCDYSPADIARINQLTSTFQ